ncbi:MAG: 50S ribosome-binding GTPase [Phycisphaerales bacterium]|nr:50S ribosome-binding GTPase [Phycisphaerales bacterium]
MTATYAILTPTAAPGAIAVIEVRADDAGAAMRSLGIEPVAVGDARVRDLLGVDLGVVARWSMDLIHLMPHGGVAVVREIARRLEGWGARAANPDPRAAYPEAETLIEARALAAIAQARSRLALDLLLDQPRRWAGAPERAADGRDRVLRRLIDPPLVVALGPPNVGKSTLVNALAGRSVSIVADEPGTTRDHVGVMLDLDGLVVRYVDTPGMRDTAAAVEGEAARVALELAARADLLLLVGDVTAAPIGLVPLLSLRARCVVATRCDLGRPPWPHDVAVSARTGTGMEALAASLRDLLVPPDLLADPSPWVFWGQPD